MTFQIDAWLKQRKKYAMLSHRATKDAQSYKAHWQKLHEALEPEFKPYESFDIRIGRIF